jgi:hypothetical protein
MQVTATAVSKHELSVTSGKGQSKIFHVKMWMRLGYKFLREAV